MSKVMNRIGAVAAAVLLVVASPKAQGDSQKFREWSIDWVSRIECGRPVQLSVRGPNSLLMPENTTTLDGLLEELSPVLRKQCPDLRDAVVVLGRTQKLVKLKRSGNVSVLETNRVDSAAQAIAKAPEAPPPPPSAKAEAKAPELVLTKVETPRRISLAGNWQGVYHVYPAFVSLELRVIGEPNGNGISDAELRLDGLEKNTSNVVGMMKARVKYSEASRAIEIDAWTEGSVESLPQRLSLRGVYSEKLRQISGVYIEGRTDASPYFVMARPQDSGDLFLKELRSEERPRPGGAIVIGDRFGRGISLVGSSPPEEKLKSWAALLLKEYPALDPYRTEMGALFKLARNLFRDKYFVPAFGKPFEKLSAADLDRTRDQIERIKAPRANFAEEKAAGAVRSVQNAFSRTGGTYMSKDIVLSVLALRGIDHWREKWVAELPQLAHSENSFQILDEIEGQLQKALFMHLPSEQKEIGTLTETTRMRLAAPLLVTKVDRLIEGATRFSEAANLKVMAEKAKGASRPRKQSLANERMGQTSGVESTPMKTDSLDTVASFVAEPLRSQQALRIDEKVSKLVEVETVLDKDWLVSRKA
jgi:hypothetical protein